MKINNLLSVLLGAISLVILIVSFNVSAKNKTTIKQELQQLINEEWQARLDRDPLMATRMGVEGADHLLLDVSDKAYQDWANITGQFLSRLNKIDRQNLSTDDVINVAILKRQLEWRIAEIDFKTYQIPFMSDSGFHTQILRLHTQVPLKSLENYENYLARLAAVSPYFEQHKINMSAGLKRGFAMPKVVMQGFSQVIKSAYDKGWKGSVFWSVFKQLPDSINETQAASLRERAEKVISQQLLPAYEDLYTFFEDTYIPQTKDSIAAIDFPQGKAYYQSQVDHYTTLDLSADAIHKIGLEEVARIRAEMQEIIKQLKFKGDFKAFLAFMRSSPQFYAKSGEELLKEAAYISKKMDAQLPKLFTKLPRQPYGVEPVPAAIAPKYTTGRYVSAPLDSERAGTYWVNTYALDKRPLYVLEALTLHEAVPGHHLQNALNQELDNLPNFRRFSYISAFGEGWGLYSERLGLEVGFYQDPYSNFGRLTYEMWRAARLIIDTGIHAKGWTREQAISLLEENSALSTHNIRTEVDRYISWPGQALAYKLGEIKIKELRAKAEFELKDKFDLRHFHDAILSNGSIPLEVLEDQIEAFIKAQSIN